MNHFQPSRGALFAEGVALSRIADEVGTPTYVYSSATLRRHLAVLQAAFEGTPALFCYSVKACSNLAVLKLLGQGGAGFDIVSGGELSRVQRTKGDTTKVVFSGVAKSRDEMAQALRAGILMFNVECEEELWALSEVAKSLRLKAPFALRVNPDVDAKTHRHIATGLKASKFGVPFEEAVALYRKSKRHPWLQPKGLDCHIGSQLTDTRPVHAALTKVAGLYRQLNASGFGLTHLDVGGGLGVTYKGEKPPSVLDYAKAVKGPILGLGATIVMEPGRVLVANAGVLLTRVVYRKDTKARRFVIIDAGMNDLVRPALYDAHHEIRPVKPRRGKARLADVVGPVCESSDVMGKGRQLGPVQQGDLLAVMSAGAYGMTMASTYNSRLRPAEVLVDGDTYRVVRRRDTVNELFKGETP